MTMNELRFEMLVVLTNNILKSIQRLKMQKMKDYGLTGAHTNCICRLERSGETGMTQLQLVQQEMMDASQISRVLRELMEKGFVQVDGTEGRYRRRYSLTESGMQLAAEVREAIDEISAIVLRDINREERDVFFKTLAAFSENLQKAEEIYLNKEDE